MSATTPESTAALLPLPSLPDQAENLIELGVPTLVGRSPGQVRAIAAAGRAEVLPVDAAAHPGSSGPSRNEVRPPLLTLPGAPIAALAALMQRGTKPGFVVQDMTDVDDFVPVSGLEIPQNPYLVHDLNRGDHLRNASPEEAQELFAQQARTPLTLSEGIFWVLAQPQALEPNHCFMTIASRLRKPNGRLDARTPALWISGGTGRDGAARTNAPKVGWCWWRNRHTWLGIASTSGRTPLG